VTPPTRAQIAYHEAGHAVVGLAQGLTFGVIYLGDASGQVIFDEQWHAEEVVRDPAVLDRYALMLLAGGYAEQRYANRVLGAQDDVGVLRRMTRAARRRGTAPRSDPWGRAAQQVDAHWPAIEALADELVRRSRPVDDPASVLAAYPHLGRTVDQTTGPRARRILSRLGASRPVPDRPAPDRRTGDE
jgi:hypothetical protein